MVNPSLGDGLGLCVRFKTDELPFLNEWKMMGQGDYVVGIEPCNVPCRSRAALAKNGMLAALEPGETREIRVTISVLDGLEEVTTLNRQVEYILRRVPTPKRS